MWNLRKIYVRTCIKAKATLAYPVTPAPPQPGLTPPIIELLMKTVLPDEGLHVWNCLLEDLSFRYLKGLIRKFATTGLLYSVLYRFSFNVEGEPSDGEAYFQHLHWKAAYDALRVLTNSNFEDLEQHQKSSLKKHVKLALLWIQGKHKRLLWEISPQLKKQEIVAQATYETWKRRAQGVHFATDQRQFLYCSPESLSCVHPADDSGSCTSSKPVSLSLSCYISLKRDVKVQNVLNAGTVGGGCP